LPHEILGVNAVSQRKDISEKLKRMFDSIDHDPKLMRKVAQIIQGEESVLRMRRIARRCTQRQQPGFRREHGWNFLTVRREQMEAAGMF